MKFDHVISDVAQVVEAVGAAIMIVGGFAALVAYVVSIFRSRAPLIEYQKLRERLSRAILLGLEVLIVGDIVRTIIVDPTIQSVGVLAMIVFIRIVLSFALEVEIDGVWPWNRGRLSTPGDPNDPGSRMI